MNADQIFLRIVVVVAGLWLLMLSYGAKAEGFTQQAPQEYHPYFYDYYQQPAQRNRREERRTQRQETERYENDQQPIVGGHNQNGIWDTNPKQINGGQGNE